MSHNLLVIEDNRSISSVIKHLGESLGYQVTIAESFAKAKTLFEDKQNFFVATVDINLPDAPNGEVIPFILRHQVPSIIMTGRMDTKTHRNIINLPIIDYIIKENAQTYHYLLRILSGQLNNNQIGILLVDTSVTSRNQLEILLKRRNFTVYAANNATEALAYLKKYDDIKMVITEQDMPVVNGIQLVHKIRKRYPANELIIIGVSDIKHNFLAERFIKNGADDYLRRPFSSEEFYLRIMQNIERLNYIEEIEKLANTNHLTGLYNRHYFVQKTLKALKLKIEEERVNSLVLIRIIDFKKINDEHGYKSGNCLLKAFAELLENYFEAELVAHFGAAEFAVLMNQDSLQRIESRLQKFHQQTTTHPFTINHNTLTIELNIGVQASNEKCALHNLLEGADNALIEASQEGGNRVHINTEEVKEVNAPSE